MRLIDEKGRLFGKINVVDFLVILSLTCLIPTFYFGYKLLNRKAEAPPPKELIKMEVDCKLIKVKPEILKLIAVGDKEIDERGEVIGAILNIGEDKPYQYVLNPGTNTEIPIICESLREIPARLKIKAEIKSDGLYYKDKKFALNSPIDFKTNRYSAVVIPFKKEEKLKERWIELKVEFPGVFPELAEMISAGDIEKDPAGRVTAKLASILSDQFSDVLTLRDDIFVKISHPFHRNIVAALDLLCIEKGGTLYSKNYPVKVGNNITFSTDLYSISGTITGLEVK